MFTEDWVFGTLRQKQDKDGYEIRGVFPTHTLQNAETVEVMIDKKWQRRTVRFELPDMPFFVDDAGQHILLRAGMNIRYRMTTQEIAIFNLEDKLATLAMDWRGAQSQKMFDDATKLVKEYHEIFSQLWELGSRGEELTLEGELPNVLMPTYYLEWWKQQTKLIRSDGQFEAIRFFRGL